MLHYAKYLALLVIPLVTCAIAVSPAAAEFETASGKSTEGIGKTGTLTYTAGGGTLTCQAANQDYLLFTDEAGGLVPQSFGNDLFEKTSGAVCSAESGVLKGVVAKVSECSFRLLQNNKGENSGIPVSIASACVVSIPVGKATCEVKIPTEPNTNLKSASVGNVGSNMEAKLAVTGISTTVNATCETGGIKGTKEGTLKGTLIYNELKAV